MRGDKKMKKWTCVQVSHHKDISKVIEEHEANGWQFHSYEAVGTPTIANHYLLFESTN